MSTYTYELVETETGHTAVWIQRDGEPVVYQPHHPAAINGEPWATSEAAAAWAVKAVEDMQTADAAYEAAVKAAEAEAAAAQTALEEDRARLIRVEAMLKELLNK